MLDDYKDHRNRTFREYPHMTTCNTRSPFKGFLITNSGSRDMVEKSLSDEMFPIARLDGIQVQNEVN
jgi:hypothetical protein